MARGSKQGNSGDFGSGKAETKAPPLRSNILRWLSPYLDEEDQIWLQGHRDDIPKFVFDCLDVLPIGYTVSSKFDDKTDRWLATCICDRVDDANRGIAVTGRGSTRINSVYTCMYIAAVKLNWQWGDVTTQDVGDFG